jgi:hypothetical protein
MTTDVNRKLKPDNNVSLFDALNIPDENLVVFGSKQPVLSKKHFILEFAKTGNISKTCANLGMSTWTVYYDWQKDPEFVEAFKKAELQHLDRMAAEADRRALDGVEKGVYWQGERVATEQQYSDNLLMFRMKRLDPGYRENSQIQINNNQVDVKRIVYHFDSPAAALAVNQLESEQPVIEVQAGEAKQIQD